MPKEREQYLETEADSRRGQDQDMHLENALFPWLDQNEPWDEVYDHGDFKYDQRSAEEIAIVEDC